MSLDMCGEHSCAAQVLVSYRPGDSQPSPCRIYPGHASSIADQPLAGLSTICQSSASQFVRAGHMYIWET